jgi:hypothetical protein
MGGADPEFPSGVSRMRPAVRSPSPGHGPPLLGFACPPEVRPLRVASFWLPAPPLPSARERARTSGCFPMRLPGSEEHGPSHGLRPPYRVSDRSLRPTRLRVDSSLGVLSPTTTSANRSGSPGFASPGTFRPQGFDPLAGLLPARRSRSEDRAPPMGFTLQGTSLRPADPFPGRGPHAVSGAPCLLL